MKYRIREVSPELYNVESQLEEGASWYALPGAVNLAPLGKAEARLVEALTNKSKWDKFNKARAAGEDIIKVVEV